jgi:glucokinase
MEADPKFSARTVFQCALDGDPSALKIFAAAGAALGIVLANLINAFNLPLYVVGGGMSRAWGVFSPGMFTELRKRSIVFRAGEAEGVKNKGTVVVPAQLSGDSGLVGAARLPMIAKTSWSFCSLAV